MKIQWSLSYATPLLCDVFPYATFFSCTDGFSITVLYNFPHLCDTLPNATCDGKNWAEGSVFPHFMRQSIMYFAGLNCFYNGSNLSECNVRREEAT